MPTTVTTTDTPTTNAIEVTNPRTGEVLYSFEEPSPADVGAAYARARAAFETISPMSVRERVAEISKLKKYLVEHKDELAKKLMDEAGKCFTDDVTRRARKAPDARWSDLALRAFQPANSRLRRR